MKKVFWILEILCLFSSSSTWAQKQAFGNGMYCELNNGVLTFSGNGVLNIFNEDIINNRYKYDDAVKTVIIKEGITAIDDFCFQEYQMHKIEIPNTVTRIGKYAFSGCKNLESIVIPTSVTRIEEYAFWKCCSLANLTLSSSITRIEDSTFDGCSSLTSVKIPNSVTTIGMAAFEGCENLVSVTLPNTITSIGPAAFSGCSTQLTVTGSKLYSIMKGGGYGSAEAIKNGNTLFYKVHVWRDGTRYGMIDTEGKIIIPTELDELEPAGTGFLRFKLNGYWGIVNYAGRIIIPTDRGYTKIGFPYEMDGYKGECNNLGVQVSKIKVNTPQTSSATSSSSSSSSTTNSNTSSNSNSNTGSGTQTVVVEHHRDPIPMQEWQACFACGGMGTMGCDNCGGSGTKYIGDRLHRCSRCNGRGIIPCNVCFGNKGQYITVYR